VRQLRERTSRIKPEKYTSFVKPVESLRANVEPRRYNEAVTGPNSIEWKVAIKSEIDSLLGKGVWKIVDRPYGKKTVRSKWIFKIKYHADGTLDKYKARLVALGNTQVLGRDCFETYSPVANLSTFRLLYGIAVKLNWKIEQMDIKTAYLNGHLEEEVYMEIPEGFEQHGSKNKVCKLERSLYGLRQSGRSWNTELDRRLKKQGLRRSGKDPCVYYQNTNEGLIIVVVYVDDLVLIAETSDGMEKLKKSVKSQSEVTELGELKFFLKIKARRDEEGNAYLSQKQYIEDVLQKYGMKDCKPAATPLDPCEKLVKTAGELTEQERVEMENVPYRQAIGSLQYLVQGTRPDIAFAVAKLGQYSSNPGPKHWRALKHVLRYLKKTKDVEMKIESSGGGIEIYCDADWAACRDERKSHTGYVIYLGNSPVIWKSTKQKCIALSTQEAEYIAMTECGKEVQWISHLLDEIGLKDFCQYPVKVNCDNQAAIALATNPMVTSRSKHIELRYHFIRNLVMENKVHIDYVPSKLNRADVFTKGLQKVRHQEMVKRLQLEKYISA
jgi:hypothetical protein